MKMIWTKSLLVLTAVIVSNAVEEPVKVTLSQKAYAQFLQYDTEIPPLKEFTVCLWVRFFDIAGDQSIFTYALKGNRLVELWLESGGRHVKVSFNEKVSSSFPVSISEKTWHHMCLSYQADYGAWAFYVDSSLVSCGAAQSLYDFVIPGGGSVLIGYGASNSGGTSHGLEGEIYGVNMMLLSTIEQSHTANNIRQRPPKTNQIRDTGTFNNVPSDDLHIDGNQYNVKGAAVFQPIENVDAKKNVKGFVFAPIRNMTRIHTRINSPNSFTDHDIGLDLGHKPTLSESSNEGKFFGMYFENQVSAKDVNRTTKDSNRKEFWNFMDQARQVGKFEAAKNTKEQSSSSTRDLPTVSQYETPPPVSSTYTVYEENKLAMDQPPLIESIYKMPEDPKVPRRTTLDKSSADMSTLSEMSEIPKAEISEIEMPPPPQNDKEVYGQWTSSKYAGTVLNYLKSIKFHKKDKRVPGTIPLHKASDNFPYASDVKVNIVLPPQMQRKGREIARQIESNYLNYPLTKRLTKRQVTKPEVNVVILQNDIRDDILRSHADTKPKYVEVTSRGNITKIRKDQRFYRNTQIKNNVLRNEVNGDSLSEPAIGTNNPTFHNDPNQGNEMKLPFLKSVEYFTGYEEFDTGKSLETPNNMYTKSLSNDNIWHNVKPYQNNYTPRKVDIKENGQTNQYSLAEEINKNHPFMRYLVQFRKNKYVESSKNTSIKLGEPTMENSNDHSRYMNAIHYNHDYKQNKNNDNHMISTRQGSGRRVPKRKVGAQSTHDQEDNQMNQKPSYFNKPVKIGNALNELHLIGANAEQKRQSFEGGHAWIPDIQRHRSESDEDFHSWRIPPSLSRRMCNNIDGDRHHLLYIQPDESIALTKIPSHSKDINTPIHFIMQSYKECSLEDSVFHINQLVLLQWSKTPVRVIGGGSPKTTKNICRSFK